MVKILRSAPAVLVLIVLMLMAGWPPEPLRAVELPAVASPSTPAQTRSNRIYLPLVATPPGPPSFLISSPTSGATVGGTSIVTTQILDPASVTSISFRAGSLDLGTDDTSADGYQAFLDTTKLPAGPVTITATARGPKGETTKAVEVIAQPAPPSSGTIGSQGGVLGSPSGATITIPPGAVNGSANVTIRERTQAEVTTETGIKWDDIGVTFLGDVAIQSSQPFSRPVAISTQGFAGRIQPGQAVVTYNLLPDQDGDGAGELVVASTAQVAPNGAIVSQPFGPMIINFAQVSNSNISVKSLAQNSLTGAPGNELAIRGQGFNPLSESGNKVVFRSSVDDEIFEVPGFIEEDPSILGQQIVRAYIPPLTPGLASVVVHNLSTGTSSPIFELSVLPAPPLSKPAFEIVDSFVVDTTAALQKADNSNGSLTSLINDITALRNALSTLNQNPTSTTNAFLNDLAVMIEGSGATNEIQNLQAVLAQSSDCLTPGEKRFFQGVAKYMRVASAIGCILATGAIFGPCQLFASIASGAYYAYVTYYTPTCEPKQPPPCQPTPGGGTPASRGIGGAPPPGGNGCGNAAGNSTSPASLAQAGGTDLTGRYIVKIFPRAGGRALSPFTGATDAGGYFFLPFIPRGEPFRAVAVDTVTGATRTFDGVGPATGESVYMFFDFFGAEDNRVAINIGDTVSDGVPRAGAGNIENPGAFDIYTFTAEPDRQVIFDVLSEAPGLADTRWKLTDGAGNVVFDRNLGDTGIVSLPGAGTYTLTVGDDNSGGTGTYSFKLVGIPLPNRFAINIGDTVSPGVPGAGAGTIEEAYVKDIYTFTATAGQQVFFDLQNAAAALSQVNWRLVAPDGAIIFDRIINCCGGNDPGVYTLPAAGTYTIIVGDNTDASTGTYGFQLWNVPASQQFAIAVGDTVSPGVPGPGAGTIETPGVRDIYTFTGNAGQQVFFDLQNAAAALSQVNWRLVAPDGAVIFDRIINCCGGNDPGVYTLPAAGTYTIIVGDNTDASTGTYGFQLWNVPASQQFAIAVGDTVSPGVPEPGAGTIETPGVRDIYTFTATAGQQVFFDLQNAAAALSQVNWRLVAPDGAVIFDRIINCCGGSDPGLYTLPTTGTYSITVGDSTDQGTGTYGFQIRLQ